LHEGQRAFCFVRARHGDQIVLTTYGRSSGFCVDPVEKKALNHFMPGTPVLSFGTSGCNLGCKFCQNWDISKAREYDVLGERAYPEDIARTAERLGCPSVAYTYNDPTIFHEYAIDTAIACHARGIKSIAVTAGYVCAEPRAEFFRHMDAANIDLKASPKISITSSATRICSQSWIRSSMLSARRRSGSKSPLCSFLALTIRRQSSNR
jgi:pyruvate formate lyase activating enzyme